MPTTTKPRRAALYCRVSTSDQTCANQIRELETVAERRGWEIVARYADAGISGTKGRDKRPGFAALADAATRREIDIVLAWSVDRLGRSLQHLVGFLADLHAADVDLYLHQQALDTTTPTGRAMFGMCGIFAEYERSMIQARVVAGLDRARARGARLGRPRTAATVEQAIRTDLAAGKGIRRTARDHGVGVSVVQRLKATGGGGSPA
jgi:DNA invertase Pin-like site-specific DNA recombinase